MLKFRPYMVAVLIVVAGVLIGRFLGSGKNQQTERQVPDKAGQVPFVEIRNGEVERPLRMSGKVQAVKKIEIFAEVSGVFLEGSKPFREGRRFAKGDVLLGIDDRVYRNNVLAEKSALLNELTMLLPDLVIDFPEQAGEWKQYVRDFSLDKSLRPLPGVRNNRLRNYVAARNIYNKFYAVRSMEETLAKYRIKAPFDGLVTVSQVNPGMLVRNGQKLGEFASPKAFELELSAPVRESSLIRAGDKVFLTTDDFDGVLESEVTRINDVIDPDTQTVGVYVLLDDPRLKDGMYLSAKLTAPVDNAAVISRELLDAENRVYALRDTVMVLLPLDVVSVDGKEAIVRGIPDGMAIVAKPVEGLFSGKVIKKTDVKISE